MMKGYLFKALVQLLIVLIKYKNPDGTRHICALYISETAQCVFASESTIN